MTVQSEDKDNLFFSPKGLYVPFGPLPATEKGDVHHSPCQLPQRSRLSITSLAPPTGVPPHHEDVLPRHAGFQNSEYLANVAGVTCLRRRSK